jgi:hypothetical protein
MGMSAPASATTGIGLTVKVTGKSGTPLSDIAVYALRLVSGVEPEDDPGVLAKAVAKQPGSYSFTAAQLLAGATYTLEFDPTGTSRGSAFSQFLGGTTSLDRAKTFTDDGSTPTISASLATNSVIAGKITGPTGAAVSGAYVQSYTDNGDGWFPDSFVKTSSKGTYTLDDADPGIYKLEVYAPSSKYAPVFSGNASSLDAAAAFSTTVGKTTTENVAFPKASGAISGKTNGQFEGSVFPLANATPVAYPVTSEDNSTVTPVAESVDRDRATYGARASSKGSWSITGLASGDYVVQLLPYYYNEESGYVSAGISAPDDLNSAKVIHVAAGKTTSAGTSQVNASETGASLSVYVYNGDSSTNAALVGARVQLQRVDDPDEIYQGTTNASGNLTLGLQGKIPAIQPGEFTIWILGPDENWQPTQQEIELNSSEQSTSFGLFPYTGGHGFQQSPTIDKTDTTVGTTYTVSAVGALPLPTLQYQWLRDGHPIYAATGSSYTSHSSDFGTQLSVRVTESSLGFAWVTESASVAGLVSNNNSAPTETSPPEITSGSGIAHPGSVLSAFPGKWSVSGLHFSYQWMRDGSPIDDTSSTHTVSLDDVGANISVVVTPTKFAYPSPVPVTADGVTPTLGSTTTPLAPFTVTSTTSHQKKGFIKYTVAPGTWTGLGSTFTYRWQLGSTTVGTSSPSYVASTASSAKAKALRVTVTATSVGYQSSGSMSQTVRSATAKSVDVRVPTVTDDGDAVKSTTQVSVGDVLDVAPGTWTNDADHSSYTYKWERKVGSAAAMAIPGATANSYTASEADVASTLSVVVTDHSFVWADATATVGAGSVVGDPELVDTVADISVPAQASVGVLIQPQVDDGNLYLRASESLQWWGCAQPKCNSKSPSSAFSRVTSATSAHFTPPKSLAGGRAYLELTVTRPGDQPAKIDSSMISIARAGTFAVVNKPYFFVSAGGSGNDLVVGSEAYVFGLTTDIAATSTATVQVCSVNCDSLTARWTPPSNPISQNEYVPSASDWANGSGRARIVATLKRSGYTTLTVTSSSMPIGEGTLTSASLPSYLYLDAAANTYTVTSRSESLPGKVPGGVESAPQWYVGTTSQPADDSYTIQPADASQPVFAVVTYAVPGYQTYTDVLVAQQGDIRQVPEESLAIIGDTYGQTLSLTHPRPWDLPDNPFDVVTYSYSWSMGGLASKQPTFTPPPSAVGTRISIDVDVTSLLYGFASDEYLADQFMAAPADEPVGNPTLSSSSSEVEPGSSLVASAVVYTDPTAGVITSYTWQTSADGNTWTTVADGTRRQYTVELADAGKELRVVATGSLPGHPSTTVNSDVAQISGGDPVQELTAPSIPASVQVDLPLTVDTGRWSHDVSLGIQWTLNGIPIAGATKSSFTPTALDAGDEISATVTASRAGELSVVDSTDSETVADGAAAVDTKAPVITASGTLFSISTGSWSIGGLDYSYQWQLNGTPIAGATGQTYARLPSDSGTLSVVVTATRYGYLDAVVQIG